ncbi:MAG: BON domain-containing protein [Rhodocyclaceae bacterium]|nr:BON domain-containing protein [Rhodocyclaceae bacterium]
MTRRRVVADILATTALAFAIGVGAQAAEDAGLRRVGDTAIDAAINGKVAAALMSDPGLLGARIDVDTRNGIVSLAGTVIADRELRRALDIASEIEGVRRVDNLLRVESVR